MGDPQSHLGECVRCTRILPVSPDRVCRQCRDAEEHEIERLTSAWSNDLDLLAQFEAYCASRPGLRPAA